MAARLNRTVHTSLTLALVTVQNSRLISSPAQKHVGAAIVSAKVYPPRRVYVVSHPPAEASIPVTRKTSTRRPSGTRLRMPRAGSRSTLGCCIRSLDCIEVTTASPVNRTDIAKRIGPLLAAATECSAKDGQTHAPMAQIRFSRTISVPRPAVCCCRIRLMEVIVVPRPSP